MGKNLTIKRKLMVTYTIYDCLEKLTVILFPESQIILLVKKKKKKKKKYIGYEINFQK